MISWTKRRRGQTNFNDWFSFGGIPRPEELMDPVLKQLDGILDDEQLVDDVFAALAGRRRSSAKTGRPSTPAEVVLRLLVLKHLRSWSYEQLQWEVTGNYVYRRFCRNALRRFLEDGRGSSQMVLGRCRVDDLRAQRTCAAGSSPISASSACDSKQPTDLLEALVLASEIATSRWSNGLLVDLVLWRRGVSVSCRSPCRHPRQAPCRDARPDKL